MSFNKLKFPIIKGNKKQRQQAEEIDRQFLEEVEKIQYKYNRALIPWIQEIYDNQERPSVITRRAVFYLRELTPEEKQRIELKFGLNDKK